MKIEKRGSSYRARKTRKGKTYTITFQHKPSQSEVEDAFHDLFNKDYNGKKKLTFRDASTKMIESKRNILSPGTVREYNRICDRMSPWFVDMDIYEMEQLDINRQINELTVGRSPKTVRNYHAFITSVLHSFRPDMNISTILPQKVKKEPYAPSREDVRRILDDLKDSEFYIPICLACYGLRRSEVAALTPDDIDGDIVHINKAMVIGEGNKAVIKTTKTTESTRDIIIPMWLADAIRAKGYVLKGHIGSPRKALQRSQQKLGIPQFSLHMMRHYFAAVLSETCDDQTVMELGGWKTDNVMKRVYRYSLTSRDEEKKRDAMKKISDSIL